jgi:hypothetical protein
MQEAFAGRRRFILPTTIDLDGRLSRFQRARFKRSQVRNLMKHYGSPSLPNAFMRISAEAKDGDLIDGGHIDFPSVRAGIPRKLKMLTILRDPVERSRSEYNYARLTYLERNIIRRRTAATMQKIAGTHSFDGFLDFMHDHRAVYGNIASNYIGWDGVEDLASLFARDVFFAGQLEHRDRFARALSDKIGGQLAFPKTNDTLHKHVLGVSAAQRSKIEQIYPRDFTLYEWVGRNV